MAIIDNLVSYWKLDETAAGDAIDAHGSHDLTNSNATINQAGKIGRAYDFNGSTSRIYKADHADFDIASGLISINLWVYIDTESGDRPFICKDEYGASRGWYFRYRGDDNELQFYAWDGADKYILEPCTLSTSTWTMLTFTSDGTYYRFYKDGSLVGAARAKALGNTADTNELEIGRQNLPTDSWFDGLIDEVGLWMGKALSDAEITSLYNSGSGLAYPFTTGPDFTKMQINIGDAWKAGAGMQINIGDSWKEVAGAQINIGDAWKTIF